MKWISVKEKLPKSGNQYDSNMLIWQSDPYYSRNGNSEQRLSPSNPTLGLFKDGKFWEWFRDEMLEIEGVTHWCEVTPPTK